MLAAGTVGGEAAQWRGSNRCACSPCFKNKKNLRYFVTDNVSRGVPGVLPAPAPAEESDGEERRPEENVGGGEDAEDPHPGQPLPLNLPAQSLHLARDQRELTRTGTVKGN